jgi:glycosyltransferase involved in cell wall biosynthesis
MKPVLWWSNSPTVGTGYGTQTKQVIDRLAFFTNVEVAANYGVEGAPTIYRTPLGLEVPLWPRGAAPFSQDVIGGYWQHFLDRHGDGLFIGLADAFVLPPDVHQGIPMHIWVPVEHMPCPPDLLHILGDENSTMTAIAMSQFGQKILADADIDSTYIPHGIERNIFRPTEGGGDIIGVPDDAFLFSIVAANKYHAPERKQFTTQMLAFQKIAKQHTDAMLYIHADPKAAGSVTLKDVAITLGLEDRVIFPDVHRYNHWGYTQQNLAAIYTRTDMVLSCSQGEGFGLCPLEAASCGTPAIVSNFSAQPELACEDSYLVDGQLAWHQGRRSFLFTPFVESIYEAAADAYNNPVAHSEKAVTLAKRYEADTLFKDYWLPYLEKHGA